MGQIFALQAQMTRRPMGQARGPGFDLLAPSTDFGKNGPELPLLMTTPCEKITRLPRRWRGPIGFLGDVVLAILGWKIVGPLPNVAKAVVIAAPHDRTADSYIGIAAVFKLRLGITFLGKASLFEGIPGVAMRWLGGIPVDRETSHDVVDIIAEKIQESERLLLLLSPEGTRKKVDRWRTGFYYIAVQAEVPILPVALDYSTRSILIGEPIYPSGDIERDAELLEAFYGALTGPIHLS